MISLELELDSNYWAPFTCLIMLTPYLGIGVEKGIYRIIGTLTGAALAFFIYGLTVQNQFYFTLFLFFIATICYYKQATSKHAGYFWFMIVLAFTLISTIGFENPISSSQFTLTAFDRAANLIIGVLTYLGVNLLIKPVYATNELNQKLHQLQTDLKNFTEEIFSQYLSSKFNTEEIDRKYNSLKKLTSLIDSLSYTVHFEKPSNIKINKLVDHVRASEFIDNLIAFYQSLTILANTAYQTNYAKQIAKILEFSSDLLSNSQNIASIDKIRSKINEQFSIITLRYDKKIKQGKHLLYTTSDTYIFQESIILLKEYLTFIVFMDSVYNQQEDSDKITIKESDRHEEYLGYQKITFLGKSFFYHKPYLKFAMRTAFTLVVVIWGWKFLDLPSEMGAANVSIAVMTASIPDYLSSNLKGLLRFLGCSLGFLLGVFLLFFSIESTILMLLCVFIVGYFSGLIMLSCPRISYMGLQVFLAFCVAFISDWGPVTSLEHILLRFIGIFFGITTVWLVSIIMWKSNYFSVAKNGVITFWKNFSAFKIDRCDNYCPSSLSYGVSLLKLNIERLTITTDFTSTEQSLLNKWCYAVERLLTCTKNIMSILEDSKKFISNIDPELFDQINLVCKNFSFPENIDSPPLLREQINKCSSNIQNLRYLIRYKMLFKDKDMSFKQETMRFIILVKRLSSRLKDINEIHMELLPIFLKKS